MLGTSGRAAPCKHGHKFKLNAPETWSVADTTIEITDPKIGRVRVTQFRTSPERSMQIFRDSLVKILAALCPRAVVSFCEATVTLDYAPDPRLPHPI